MESPLLDLPQVTLGLLLALLFVIDLSVGVDELTLLAFVPALIWAIVIAWKARR